MSHVVTCEATITDLEALKLACKRLGWVFKEGQKTYRWFGQHVGDYPLPKGFKVEDMGKCDHAIEVPGVNYEIGLVRKGAGFTPIYDFYDSGLRSAVGGIKGEKLVQHYGVEWAKRKADSQHLRYLEETLPNGKIKLKVFTK